MTGERPNAPHPEPAEVGPAFQPPAPVVPELSEPEAPEREPDDAAPPRRTGLLVAAVVVATAVIIVAALLARRAGDGAAPTPAASSPQVADLAWASELRAEELILDTPNGLLTTPQFGGVGTEVAMRSYDDGAELWRVDLADQMDGSPYAFTFAQLAGDHVAATWRGDETTDLQLALIDTGNGTIERTLTVPDGSYFEVSSGAVYRLWEEAGIGYVSRYTSFADFTKQWDAPLDLAFGDVQPLFEEVDGRLEICLQPLGQNRPVVCSATLDLATGERPDWLPETATFQRAGDVVAVADYADGTLRGYRDGAEIWNRSVTEPSLLGIGGLLFLENAQTFINIDPATGQERWRMDRGERALSLLAIGDQLVVAQTYPTWASGIVDPGTGRFELAEHNQAEATSMLPVGDGTLLGVHENQYGGVFLVEVTPGQAQPTHVYDLAGYTGVLAAGDRIIAYSSTKVAVIA